MCLCLWRATHGVSYGMERLVEYYHASILTNELCFVFMFFSSFPRTNLEAEGRY